MKLYKLIYFLKTKNEAIDSISRNAINKINKLIFKLK